MLMAILVGLGRFGIIGSSILTVPDVVLRGFAHPEVFRGLLILAISLILTIIGLSFGQPKDQWYEVVGKVILLIGLCGCLGIIKVLLYHCLVVQPHPSLTQKESVILAVAILFIAIVCFMRKECVRKQLTKRTS